MEAKKKFDYTAAIAELERIARKVEDPSTGIDDIDKVVKRSNELIGQCRQYLRTVRTKVEAMDKDMDSPF